MNSGKSPPHDKRGAARVIAGGATARIISLPIGAICIALTAYVSIRYVGDETYGYVNLVAFLFLLIPFADFGLGVIVVNVMSRSPAGVPPTPDQLQTIWRVLVRLAAIALLLCSISTLIGILRGWTKLLNLPTNLIDADLATTLALSIFFLAIPVSIGQKILIGISRVSEMTIISLTAPILTTLLTVIMVTLGAPPMYLAVAPAAGTLGTNVFLTWRASKVLDITIRDLRCAAPTGPPERLANSAISYFVVSLGVPIALQSDRIILAHFSTARELSAYSLMAQMYAPALSVITIGAIALWPAYKQRGDDTRTLWLSSLRALTLLGGLMAFIFGFASPFLATVISEGEIRPSVLLVTSFAGLILVMSVHQASALLLTDERGLRFQAYCVLALAIISIGLSIIFAQHLGAPGPVLASIIAVTSAQLLPGMLRARNYVKVVAT